MLYKKRGLGITLTTVVLTIIIIVLMLAAFYRDYTSYISEKYDRNAINYVYTLYFINLFRKNRKFYILLLNNSQQKINYYNKDIIIEINYRINQLIKIEYVIKFHLRGFSVSSSNLTNYNI